MKDCMKGNPVKDVKNITFGGIWLRPNLDMQAELRLFRLFSCELKILGEVCQMGKIKIPHGRNFMGFFLPLLQK